MISIIDYKAGNPTSVKRALDYIGVTSEITSDPDAVLRSERIIFPGVGHARYAMDVLKQKNLDIALKEAFARGVPILGICLGTQIILSYSEEGNSKCLDLIKGATVKFNLINKKLKIPHMGWNSISIIKNHPVLYDTKKNDEFYFVHSYYPVPECKDFVFAECEYEIKFPAVIGTKNLIATQFHPEKSAKSGLAILKRFTTWDGTIC